MLACLFPFYTAPARPQHPDGKRGATGTPSGHVWTSVSPAAPRISHRSSWWHAFRSGCIKGLLYWSERKILDSKLPRATREQNPEIAKIALQQALRSALENDVPAEKARCLQELEISLKDAIWYGVDVERVVWDAFPSPASRESDCMRIACQYTTSLAIISNCLADSYLAYENLKRQLRTGFFKSNEYSRAGLGFDSDVQKKLWSDIEGACRAAAHLGFQREELLDEVLRGSDRNELLFLATHHYLGCSGSFSVLKTLSEKAFFQLEIQLEKKKVTDIGQTSLNDAELKAYCNLVKCYNFRRFKAIHESERQRREVIKAEAELFMSFRQRLMRVGSTKDDDIKPQSLSAESPKITSVSEDVQKAILRKAISASDPEIIIKVANLANINSKDRLLVEAAIDYLAAPVLKELDDNNLIAYLGFAENVISPRTRALLVEEANNRANATTEAATRLIAEQLKSDSALPFTCRRLIRAALEMSALEKVTVELQKATGARCVPQSIETDRSAEALYKDSMLRNLPDKLRKNYTNQSGRAERIDSFLSRLHAGESRSDPMPLKKRDEEEIDEALYDFLPGSGSFDRPLGLERLTANQENRFRAMLSEHILQTANSRRVAENSQEFPVCSQFLRDTTEAHLSVNSVLIPQMLNPRIPTHSVSRGRPFLNEMRKLKGVTDAQIFMTSRIATQSIASVFSDFVFQEGLFSLTTAEMNAGNFSKASLGDKGLLPADLQFDENVFMKENGNLVIRVHAAQKNIKEWKDKNVNETLLRTDESSSSFMAELNFEIDREGEMLEDLSIKIGFERTIVVQSAS